MSHITTVQTEIKDIEAVKALCAELGFTFHKGATAYQGYTNKEACVHKITVNDPLIRYEIGLVQNPNGTFSLAYDHMLEGDWTRNNANRAAAKQQEYKFTGVGKGACKLMQLYAVHKASIEAKKRGLIVQRKTVPGTQRIQLVCTGC